MALPKLFQRIFWHNNTTPAINEDNLNSMSKAIDDIDDRVIALGDDVMEVIPQIQTYLDQAEDLVEAMENLSKHPPYIGANGDWYVWDTNSNAFVDSGVDASITVSIADITMLSYGQTPYVTNTGTSTDPIFHLFIPRAAGIASISKTGTSILTDTYTITFDDGTTSTYTITNGKGIVSISKTGTSGLVDTYTITYNDSTTSTFTVTNGDKGDPGTAAGFGTPTASVDGNVGTPSVTITASGPDTAKVFEFAFSNLKGQQGVQGDPGPTGNGIASITKTGTSGLVDTYTITFTNGTTSTFTVTNGQDGQGSGDMLKSDYDSASTVKDAGGIVSYITGLLAGYAAKSHASSTSDYGLGTTTKYGHTKVINGLTQAAYADGEALSAYQGKVLNDALSGKQATLTFDNAPTSGSDNPCKSGGIFSNTVSNVAAGSTSASSDGAVRISVTKGDISAVNDCPVTGWDKFVGKWTSEVTANVGDTSVSLSNPYGSTAIEISPFSENSSGLPINITSYSVSSSTITLNFDALTVQTKFKCKVTWPFYPV